MVQLRKALRVQRSLARQRGIRDERLHHLPKGGGFDLGSGGPLHEQASFNNSSTSLIELALSKHRPGLRQFPGQWVCRGGQGHRIGRARQQETAWAPIFIDAFFDRQMLLRGALNFTL